jgi:hypothetical protein
MDIQTIAAKPNCMTLGNMRTNGVRSLAITCGAMGHHCGVLDVSAYSDDVPVPAFGSRMVWSLGTERRGRHRG